MSEVSSILDVILMRAKKRKKPSGVFYALKALVELGKGWHTFKEVLAKMIEISGNTKLMPYPIQDVVKYKLAIIEAQKGVPTGDIRVKLRGEVFDEVARYLDEYANLEL